MRFWDSSAILPLIIPDTRSESLVATLREDPAIAVWWVTPVECASALARLTREGRLDDVGSGIARRRLGEAAREWTEVPALERVRDQAMRLLRLHPLRAADALQLAAAIVLSEHDPPTLPFVTVDQQLARAAELEGFELT